MLRLLPLCLVFVLVLLRFFVDVTVAVLAALAVAVGGVFGGAIFVTCI